MTEEGEMWLQRGRRPGEDELDHSVWVGSSAGLKKTLSASSWENGGGGHFGGEEK